MKAKEIRDLTTAEIEQKIKSLKEEFLIFVSNWLLVNLKIQRVFVKFVNLLLV